MLGHAFELFREVVFSKDGTVLGDIVEHLRFRHIDRRLVNQRVEINFSSFLLSEAGTDFAQFFLRFDKSLLLLLGFGKQFLIVRVWAFLQFFQFLLFAFGGFFQIFRCDAEASV